jgi:hypothetical protein
MFGDWRNLLHSGEKFGFLIIGECFPPPPIAALGAPVKFSKVVLTVTQTVTPLISDSQQPDGFQKQPAVHRNFEGPRKLGLKK